MFLINDTVFHTTGSTFQGFNSQHIPFIGSCFVHCHIACSSNWAVFSIVLDNHILNFLVLPIRWSIFLLYNEIHPSNSRCQFDWTAWICMKWHHDGFDFSKDKSCILGFNQLFVFIFMFILTCLI